MAELNERMIAIEAKLEAFIDGQVKLDQKLDQLLLLSTRVAIIESQNGKQNHTDLHALDLRVALLEQSLSGSMHSWSKVLDGGVKVLVALLIGWLLVKMGLPS
jgi:hypothetical protein